MAEKALKQPDVFVWTGTDKRGVKVKGQSRGSNPNLIRAELRKQGINPIKVKRKSEGLFGMGGRKKKITAGDIAIFARQLATMMSAGVPLVQSFDIVGRGHNNPAMQDMVLSIKADIEGGTALTEALRKHPLQFDDLFCNLVQAGEQAGVLETLLDKIATEEDAATEEEVAEHLAKVGHPALELAPLM